MWNAKLRGFFKYLRVICQMKETKTEIRRGRAADFSDHFYMEEQHFNTKRSPIYLWSPLVIISYAS